MSKPISLNAIDKSHIQAAMNLYIDSVRRAANKHPTGSALHTAYTNTVNELLDVSNKVFALEVDN